MKKNPTWPGTKHPDFFGKDTAVAVRQDDEEEVAEYEALEEVLQEELEELCDAFVAEMDKSVEAEQEYMLQNDNDTSGHYFESFFEPWLQDNAADVLETADREDRIDDVLADLRTKGVSEESLQEFFLRTDLYTPEMREHTYRRQGVYSVAEDNYEQEREWSELSDKKYNPAAGALAEWLEKHYDDVEWNVYLHAEKYINRHGNFSIDVNRDETDFKYVRYSLSFSVVVEFDVDAVVDGLLQEFGDFEPEVEPEEEIEQDAFYTLPPQMGGFVVKKLSAKELPEESKQLGICVGKPQYGYTDAVKQGKIDIWSVRTPSGRSKFTIEAAKKDGEVTGIVQVKGKANRLPGFTPGERDPSNVKADEVKMLEKFFTDINIDPWTISDLEPGMRAVYGPKKNPPKMVPIPKRTFDMPWAPR